ncbi:MAG TPA: nucleotidyltransferase family protein, partial [Vicinamibacteria bacterium]
TGTVLSTVATRLLEGPIDHLVVVLGHEAQAVRAAARLPDDPRLRIVVNEEWAEGMASSLRAGLAASEEADALLVALGDQPGVDPEVIGRLLAAWREGARIAAVFHAGRLTHPVVFDRSLFPALRLVKGDVGARAIVRAHWDDVVRVVGPALHDLDTPSDYEAFTASGRLESNEGLDRS